MASDLLAIARSSARAAQTALGVTSQNIANASNPDYVRRSVALVEVAGTGGGQRTGEVTLSGVRVNGIIRNADMFRQAEVRRTTSDSSRAGAEVQGLENIEAAVEQSGIYDSIVKFEGSLQQLASDPTDASLRAATIESGRTMAQTFNIASSSLDSVATGLQFESQDGVDQVNTLAQELGRVNLQIVRVGIASGDSTTLLDQRDSILQKLSEKLDITTTFAVDNTVSVKIGGAAGGTLVNGGNVGTVAMATAANDTVSFTLDGNALSLSSGSLAGKAQALQKLTDIRTGLDAAAAGVIAKVNAAQANGVALDGSAGQPLFTGTGAGDIAMAVTEGKHIATAPAGAAANSRDTANLDALRDAMNADSPAEQMDTVLFDISSAVAGRRVTKDALDSIASSASIALQAQAGVDLDQEAVNLLRYQQVFQASGRIMQVASTLFDTLIGIR